MSVSAGDAEPLIIQMKTGCKFSREKQRISISCFVMAKWLIVSMFFLLLSQNVFAQRAKYLGEDRQSQGDWRGRGYGKNGYLLSNMGVINPTYATPVITGEQEYLWSESTADVRALLLPDDGSRKASCWFSAGEFTISIPVNRASGCKLSLYCVDWDGLSRSQRIEIRNAATDALLDARDVTGFGNGVYVSWNISGNIRVKIVNTGSVNVNAVVSGLFFDTPLPEWWTSGSPPVIDVEAEPNNQGPANIGQAKWMTKSALEALRKINVEAATAVETDLVGQGKIIPSWDVSATDDQRAALLIGQLKALSAPFYVHLNAKDPSWLSDERLLNGTMVSGSYFPWTSEIEDDSNTAVATIGQLKAVFSLRFDSFPHRDDEDADGIMESEDADPEDGSIGRLSVSIISPLSGATVR